MVDENSGVDEHEEELYKEAEAEKEENLSMSIQASTDHLEKRIVKVAKDTKTHFELVETKLKMTELDMNINVNLKIAKAEENLGQKIDENSSRLTNVEETLANLLKA
ncbi:hypothetical protein Dimus_029497 [Dionaea muscipula]